MASFIFLSLEQLSYNYKTLGKLFIGLYDVSDTSFDGTVITKKKGAT